MIVWYGDSRHKKWFAPHALVIDAVGPVPVESLAKCDHMVIDANWGRESRTARGGLRWLQHVRRIFRATSPALVYSFETREVLASSFSIMAEGVPGLSFLRLPFTTMDFQTTLDRTEPLAIEELDMIVRWHSGLQEDWQLSSHRIVTLLRYWPSTKAEVESFVNEWQDLILRCAPDQVPNMQSLVTALDRDSNAVRSALEQIGHGLRGIVDAPIPEAPCNRPPRGFSELAIADDSGYELDTIVELKRLGYSVCDKVAITSQEAENLIELLCPHVVLVDLHMPSASDGRRVIEFAQRSETVRLIVAISRSGAVDLHLGVEDCCGPQRFADADRIHRIIWQRALMEGVTPNDCV